MKLTSLLFLGKWTCQINILLGYYLIKGGVRKNTSYLQNVFQVCGSQPWRYHVEKPFYLFSKLDPKDLDQEDEFLYIYLLTTGKTEYSYFVRPTINSYFQKSLHIVTCGLISLQLEKIWQRKMYQGTKIIVSNLYSVLVSTCFTFIGNLTSRNLQRFDVFCSKLIMRRHEDRHCTTLIMSMK